MYMCIECTAGYTDSRYAPTQKTRYAATGVGGTSVNGVWLGALADPGVLR